MNKKNRLLANLLATALLMSTSPGWAQQADEAGQTPLSAMSAPPVATPLVAAPSVPSLMPSESKASKTKAQANKLASAAAPASFADGSELTANTSAPTLPSNVPADLPPVTAAPVGSVDASSLLNLPQGAQLAETTPQSSKPQPMAATTTQPAAAARKIELPVPVAPAEVPDTSDLLVLPLSKTKGISLGKVARDIIIGNPDIADIVVRSQTQIYLIGKKIGDTNVFLVDSTGNLIRKIDIVVQPDAESVQSNIAALLPGEQISAKGMGDSIVLSGSASSDGVAARARNIARRFVDKDEKVVSMIKVVNEQQVLLRVKVAEIQKTVLKEMGVDNLLKPQTIGPLAFGFATSSLGLTDQIAGLFGVTSSDFDSTIRLLEKQGLVRTLAEPNLLAVSGETASLLAGGEYPVLTPGQTTQNDTVVSVQYKPFGVSLAFIPVVLDAGRISLKVSTEVSALSNDNALVVPFGNSTVSIKSFTTRRANSTVELPSGGGMMIAGLLQNDINSAINGTPGLMDLPILGTLFRSTSFQRNETELVILVSVVLAKPADPRQLATPTDGFAPSTDLDRYFMGHIQNIYSKRPAGGPNAPQKLQGPLGYIVK